MTSYVYTLYIESKRIKLVTDLSRIRQENRLRRWLLSPVIGDFRSPSRFALRSKAGGDRKVFLYFPMQSKIRFLIESFLMQKLYLIKDVAAQSGYSIYTLKFYLKIGLIKEVSRSPETEFRYFDDTTLEFLKKIHSLRLENKSLKEIKAILIP